MIFDLIGYVKGMKMALTEYTFPVGHLQEKELNSL